MKYIPVPPFRTQQLGATSRAENREANQEKVRRLGGLLKKDPRVWEVDTLVLNPARAVYVHDWASATANDDAQHLQLPFAVGLIGKRKSASRATPLVVAGITPVDAGSAEERRLKRIKKEVKKWFFGLFSGDINLIREAATPDACREIAVEAGRADLDQGQLFLQFEKDLAKYGEKWEKMELWKAC